METILNPNKFLASKLIKRDNRAKTKKLFNSPSDAILECIDNGLIEKKDFYPNLASLYKLRYFKDIPVNMNSQSSLAQQIPQQFLVSKDFYVLKNDDKMIIITHNPFSLDEKFINQILSFTSLNNYSIAISNPVEIRNAIAKTFYYDLNISSEDMVSVLHPTQSMRTYSTRLIPKIFPIFTLIAYAVLLILFPAQVLFVSFVILNIIYFIVNPYKFYVFFRSFWPAHMTYITKKQVKKIDESKLPVYSIFIPLKDEEAIVKQIVGNILKLDYPASKLDIKFITEIRDAKTNAALNNIGVGIPSPNASQKALAVQLVKVPPSSIATKPRSVDYALGLARGSLATIYDAEDAPDPDQLKKAALGFRKTTLDTVCLQAKLNYYNSRQNALTKLFSLEYGFWFDYYLPGLNEINAPIPLGGTSNHFITSTLRKLGSWDAYNVTEDADLGLRIFRYKLRTSIINSKTLEEANSKLGNWIRQRTRWQKGFLVTFLVHTAHPLKLLHDLGPVKFILSMLTFGGNFFLPLFNIALWLFFIASIAPQLAYFSLPPTPNIIFIISLFNLIVGNLTYITIHLVSSLTSRRLDLAPYSLLLPFYWMLISVATLRAAIQFVRNPYYWEKTKHGLSK